MKSEEITLVYESKEYNFKDILEILIKKHENETNSSRDSVRTFLSLLIGLVITLFVSYIGWNTQQFQEIIKFFLEGNSTLKFIFFCVSFTLLFLEYKLIMWLVNRKLLINRVEKLISLDRFFENEKKLNKLYLASLKPKKWFIKIKINEEEGIFELKEIGKR